MRSGWHSDWTKVLTFNIAAGQHFQKYPTDGPYFMKYMMSLIWR